MSKLDSRKTLNRTLRRPTNLNLSVEATGRAKEYGLNISRIAEDAIVEAVRRHEGERWKEENAEAIKAYNEWVEQHGLTLRSLRLF
ncbi:type II toxin-antitoxin system CcdA family antitoxin [Inquilinus sp.]|uniref:type II toxin-antitoxin system CcdA family antitoxin n=1 Tax=Inquilinus sp. TaxID=1932117 RepID=UPI0031DBBDDF